MSPDPDDERPPPSLRDGFPFVWWLAIAFSALCVMAGLAVAWLLPRWH
jgi:hypothetical protein